MEAARFWDFTPKELNRLKSLGIKQEYLNEFNQPVAILKLRPNVLGVVSLDSENEEEAEYLLESISTSLDETIKSFTAILVTRCFVPVTVEQREKVTTYGIDTRRINSFDAYKISMFKFADNVYAIAVKHKDDSVSLLKMCETLEDVCKQMQKTIGIIRKDSYNPFEPMESAEYLYEVIPYTPDEKEEILDAISCYQMYYGVEEYAFNYIVPGKTCMLKLKSGKWLIAEPVFDGEKVRLYRKRTYPNQARALIELLRRVARYAERLDLFEEYINNNYGDALNVVGPITYLHIAIVTAVLSAVAGVFLPPLLGFIYFARCVQALLVLITIVVASMGIKKEWQTLRAKDSFIIHSLVIVMSVAFFVIPFI